MMDEFLNSLTPEQKMKMVQALMKDLDVPENHIETPVTNVEPVERKSVPTVNDDFTVTRKEDNNGRKAVRAKKNQWSDDGSEHMDIETPEFKRTARNRPKPKKKKVSCHVCGKNFSVNASLSYGEYHRCNKCTG